MVFAMIRAHGNAGNLAGELYGLGDATGLWERQQIWVLCTSWELLWVSINLADHRVY